MKIKSIIPIILLLYSISCTTEEHEGRGGPVGPVVEEGYSLMQISIHDRQKNSSTYAPEKFDAYPEEKEIRSVAFFTQTDDEGKFGDANFQLGAFNKYFSTETLKSVNGLYETLEHTPSGYTVSIKVKSDGFGPKTQVYVIANYAENGLTDILKRVEKWEDLKHIKTTIETDNLQTPLLMIAYKSDVPLKSTQTETVTFQLTRIVSRIDVINEAIDPVNGDPKKSFVMESAQIIQPREYSYLLPNNEFKPIIPVLPFYPAVKAGNPPESDDKRVMALYMYETDNQGDESMKTIVRIKGELMGVPYSRDIPLKKPDTPGKDGDPIALVRNNRYQVTIKLVDTSGEIIWNIGVADWDDTNPIDVDPTIMTPVITPNITPDMEVNWNPVTRTYIFEEDKNETVKLTVNSLRTTVYSLAFEYENGDLIGLDDPGSESYRKFLKVYDPVITYANVEQVFEVSTPQLLDESLKVPVLIKIYFYDITDKFYKDSIRFDFVPKYEDTEHFPVKVGGIYWAPVNVGAKNITNEGLANLDNQGWLIQWGRNEGFTSPEQTTLAVGEYAPNPISYEASISAPGNKQFIIWPRSQAHGDWLSDGANTPGRNARDVRWSAEVNDSPCPKGWRVPSAAEVQKMKDRNALRSWADNRLGVKGDEDGRYLYFPANYQYRVYSNAAIGVSTAAHYWTSDYYTSSYYGGYWNFNLYGISSITSTYTSHGFFLRCIQNIP